MAVDTSYQPKVHRRQGGDEFVVASGGKMTVESGGAIVSVAIVVPDANTTILAADSGKIHLVANVSANRTFTLPTAAEGLYFEFWSTVVAKDADDWIIVADSTDDFYLGGFTFHDEGDSGGVPLICVPDGTTDHTVQIINPSAGCKLHFYSDGTNWFLNGNVFADTIPTFT